MATQTCLTRAPGRTCLHDLTFGRNHCKPVQGRPSPTMCLGQTRKSQVEVASAAAAAAVSGAVRLTLTLDMVRVWGRR